jgi:CDGSH iron-sulfur domain-containing protein 3
VNEVTIKVRENGPYLVTGPVTLTDSDGAVYELPEGKDRLALCRCGRSSTKPFCDKTHREVGFDAPEGAVR